MGYVAGTLYRSPMAKFLSWTIYFYDFESYLFDRELFYEKVCFLSGLVGMVDIFFSGISYSLTQSFIDMTIGHQEYMLGMKLTLKECQS